MQAVLFQTILFSVNRLFNSILSIERTYQVLPFWVREDLGEWQ